VWGALINLFTVQVSKPVNEIATTAVTAAAVPAVAETRTDSTAEAVEPVLPVLESIKGKLFWLQSQETIPVPLSKINMTRSIERFFVRGIKKAGVKAIMESMSQFYAITQTYFDPQWPVLLYATTDGYVKLCLLVCTLLLLRCCSGSTWS